METKLMTIRDVAEYLRLSEQTIQRYVLKREIPYLKIKKVIRFRPREIEEWAERDRLAQAAKKDRNRAGDLFAGLEIEQAGEPAADTAEAGEAERRTGAVERGTETGEVKA
jgi:excisionase family DNA binding protein